MTQFLIWVILAAIAAHISAAVFVTWVIASIVSLILMLVAAES